MQPWEKLYEREGACDTGGLEGLPGAPAAKLGLYELGHRRHPLLCLVGDKRAWV